MRTRPGLQAPQNTQRTPNMVGSAQEGRDTGLAQACRDATDVVRALTPDDYRQVNEAYLLRSAFNEGRPGWDVPQDDEDRDAIGVLVEKSSHDEYLARLAWLRFWVRWALDHCAQPAMVVSW